MAKKIITIDVWEAEEVTSESVDHVFKMIGEGYTSGEICQSTDDDTASGWWSVEETE